MEHVTESLRPQGTKQENRRGMPRAEAVKEAARHMAWYHQLALEAIRSGVLRREDKDDAAQQMYLEAVRCLEDRYDPQWAYTTFIKHHVAQNAMKSLLSGQDRYTRDFTKETGQCARVGLGGIVSTFDECAAGPPGGVYFPAGLRAGSGREPPSTDDLAELDAVISRLGPKLREVIDLERQGLTQGQIAISLGISQQAVSDRRGRAIDAMRRAVGMPPVSRKTRTRPATAGRIAPAEPLPLAA